MLSLRLKTWGGGSQTLLATPCPLVSLNLPAQPYSVDKLYGVDNRYKPSQSEKILFKSPQKNYREEKEIKIFVIRFLIACFSSSFFRILVN